jgi:hypothetical protein
VEEAVFSPMYVFGAFVKNQMVIAARAYFWIFYHTIPLDFMSVFVPLPCCSKLFFLFKTDRLPPSKLRL